MLLQNGVAAPLRKDGIINLYELCAEDETQMNRNEQIRIANVKLCFSISMIELAGAYNEDENDDSQGLTQYLDQNREWKQLQVVTTREMQLTLKKVMNKIDVKTFDQRLGMVG